MGLRRDMVRTAERKHRFWQRVERERALASEQPSEHIQEYVRVVGTERKHFQHLAKINQLRRQKSN